MNSRISIRHLSIAGIFVLLTACGGTRTVPITIQSNPLGGHVVYQLPPGARGGSTDWVYLGKTPIDIKQNVDKSDLGKAQAFRVKIFKDGFNEQIRDWSEQEIDEEVEEKGHVFWNPKLVPNGG